ncbi:MAG: hypothetical protein AAB487_02830 [Patescibacteria group bacterium]
MVTVTKYCPIHEKRPERPMNQNPMNLRVSIPEICLSCQALNSTLIAEIRAVGKVRVCAPGKSGLDGKDQQKSLFNPHRIKKAKANRSKSQPP